MDPRWEHIMNAVMLAAALGIAALTCQFGIKLGHALAREIYLCGSLC